MTTHTSSLNAASPSGIANAWLLRERVQPSTSWPKSTRFTLKTFQGYLLSDTQKIGLQASLWTNDKTKAQIYYDLDNAFRKSAILETIANCPVEVVRVD